MKVTIRECQYQDIEDIYLLNKNEMGYDYPLEKTRKKIECLLKSKHDKIYVAEIEHKVVGYIHANDYDVIYMDHLKNIMGIAVSQEYRRFGIGRRLLLSVEDWARDNDAKGVRLVSGETRLDAHEFYKHCGYISKKKQLNFMKWFDSYK